MEVFAEASDGYSVKFLTVHVKVILHLFLIEWEFWRSFDFAVCVVSLAFASMLLYGAITVSSSEFDNFLTVCTSYTLMETLVR